MFDYIVLVYVLFLGLTFGSFSNMLVYRLYIGQDIGGRSYCDKTKKTLRPIDLIPVISYVIFRGRCRECGAKLPLVYPLVELANGLIWLGVYSILSDRMVDLVTIFIAIVVSQVLFVIGLYDFWYIGKRQTILQFITLLLGLFGLFKLPVENLGVFLGVVGCAVFGLVSVSLIAKKVHLIKIPIFPFVLLALLISFLI